jgi:hypothetical protein
MMLKKMLQKIYDILVKIEHRLEVIENPADKKDKTKKQLLKD